MKNISDKDLEKMMKFVIEHKSTINSILTFLNEDTTAGTACSSDGIENSHSMDGEGVVAENCEDDEDEVLMGNKEVIDEGDSEKANTEHSSDGIDYPDVGDGTGVEGETLKENMDDYDDDYDYEEEPPLDPEGDSDEEDKALKDYNLDETCAAGAGTPSMGAVTGDASPIGGGVGSNTANDGVARVKTRLGDDKDKVHSRMNESEAPDAYCKAMLESFKIKSHWTNLY